MRKVDLACSSLNRVFRHGNLQLNYTECLPIIGSRNAGAAVSYVNSRGLKRRGALQRLSGRQLSALVPEPALVVHRDKYKNVKEESVFDIA